MKQKKSTKRAKKQKPRNLFEKSIEAQIRRAKVKYKYESERIPYILARHYIPDFILETPLGKIYVECKGYFRPEAKAKMAAVRRQHPHLDIRIVFYSSSATNIRWAERLGIRYSIGSIPDEWWMGL